MQKNDGGFFSLDARKNPCQALINFSSSFFFLQSNFLHLFWEIRFGVAREKREKYPENFLRGDCPTNESCDFFFFSAVFLFLISSVFFFFIFYFLVLMVVISEDGMSLV